MRRLLILIFTCAWLTTSAQRNEAYLQYIESYKDMAIEQMLRNGIPASITLAQGILESNAGRSVLATTANNHFGIKVGTSWTGPYVIKDDDRTGEHFRKYNNAAESYEDHSAFLRRPRYAGLFNLSLYDYRGWAHGLKAAGYATNPRYPELLIGIIEMYDLAMYDHKTTVGKGLSSPTALAHTPRLCNDLVYVIAQPGDSFDSIAREMGISKRRLMKYNEVDRHYSLRAGDIVFLAKKKSHVEQKLRKTFHRIEAGESLYTISQRYGVRLKNLYKWNDLDANYRPKVGDVIILK